MMNKCTVGVRVSFSLLLDIKNLGITRDGSQVYVDVISVMTKIVDIPCG